MSRPILIVGGNAYRLEGGAFEDVLTTAPCLQCGPGLAASVEDNWGEVDFGTISEREQEDCGAIRFALTQTESLRGTTEGTP